MRRWKVLKEDFEFLRKSEDIGKEVRQSYMDILHHIEGVKSWHLIWEEEKIRVFRDHAGEEDDATLESL